MHESLKSPGLEKAVVESVLALVPDDMIRLDTPERLLRLKEGDWYSKAITELSPEIKESVLNAQPISRHDLMIALIELNRRVNATWSVDEDPPQLARIYIKRGESPPYSEDSYLFRPVLEEPPDPKQWVPIEELSSSSERHIDRTLLVEVPTRVYWRAVGQGLYPVSFGIENHLEHDITHYLAALQFPDYHRALADFLCSKEAESLPQSMLDPKATPTQLAYYLRVSMVSEYFTLPDIEQADDILSSLGHLQLSEDLVPAQVIERERLRLLNLAKLSETSFPDELERLVKIIRPTIVRMGGGNLDGSMATDHAPLVYWGPWQVNRDLLLSYSLPNTTQGVITCRFGQIGASPSNESLNDTSFSHQLYVEDISGILDDAASLVGILREQSAEAFDRDLKDLAQLAERSMSKRLSEELLDRLRKGTEQEGAKERVIEFFAERFARLEVALAVATSLKITPAEFAVHALQPNFDLSSRTGRFISVLAAKNSLLDYAFSTDPERISFSFIWR